jgi:hypothetical protein
MVVLIDVFRILCFSLVTQLGFELELESFVVPKGDVVYGRISYRNTSDTPVTIEQPFRCDPYFLPTTVGVNIQFPKSRPEQAWTLGRLGGGEPTTLQPNESDSCIVLLSPWDRITRNSTKKGEVLSVAPELLTLWDNEVGIERNKLTMEAWANFYISDVTEEDLSIEKTSHLPRLVRKTSKKSLHIDGCVLLREPSERLFRFFPGFPDGPQVQTQVTQAQRAYWRNGGSYRRTRKEKVHRMTPVWISDFDLDLGWDHATLDDLRDLAKDLKQDTNIARIVQLTLECNKWVQSESLDDRLKLEKALQESIETYRPLEREFLAKALKLIFSTKQVEYGAYGSKP